MLKQHLEKLENFREVALQGSILRASRVLGLSQPALTKSLMALEKAIGQKLLIRYTRGVRVTEAGKILLAYAERLNREVNDVEARLKSRKLISGVVTIGSFETLGVSFWPQALKNLKQACPELGVRICTESPGSLWQRLSEGVVDLIVDAEPQIKEAYFSKVLYTDRFGLFVKQGFRSSAGSLPLAYVRRAYDREGKSIHDHLWARRIENEFAYDLDTFISVRALVEEGLAVGVLPLSLVSSDFEGRKLEALRANGHDIVFGEHRLCATCLEERRDDPRLIAVMKSLKLTAKGR